MKRTRENLNTGWLFSKTASEAPAAFPAAGSIEAEPDIWEPISLPHTWNALDGQDGGNDYYRGTCWYMRELIMPRKNAEEEFWLEFEGAAMTAEVWLDGVKLCRHEGGYSTFRVRIADELLQRKEGQDNEHAGGHLLAVSVDNSENGRIYPQKADFTFYGGIYRDVWLIRVPRTHFALSDSGGPGIRVTPRLHGSDADVEVEVMVEGDARKVYLETAGQTCTAEVKDGYARAVVRISDVHRWDGVEDPWLYHVRAWLDSGDEISARYGCREIAFDPEKGFFLNGRSYPLRGVCRHQDREGVGNALTKEMHDEDMAVIREIGANTVRLAHYQQAQYFYDLCDENGLIVWAEIPYITRHMPGGRENTLSQMKELVVQNYNHPSIVCWGLSNEITAGGAVTEDMLENHRMLNDLCHSLDSTRPTTMAHVFMLETDSPIVQLPDIGSYNLYFGWYVGELEQNGKFFDDYHRKYPGRVIGFSEYGADANPQFQSPAPDRGDYTESYQCVYHEHLLKCIEERPYLWASHLWNLFDFAADGRDEGGKHGVNQKGLVTMDRKLRKDAFYLYKAHWSREPFVHLCGRRYRMRAEETTEIKVYSNLPFADLYVDGVHYERKEGRYVFCFQVPITGVHKIQAVSGECTDEMEICRTAEPDENYCFQKKSVINWFDREAFIDECYSIQDKLGDIKKSPEGARIIEEMMAKAGASRGDVAESTAGNEMLEQLMNETKVQTVLKQVGDVFSLEEIKELNAKLQKIRKV